MAASSLCLFSLDRAVVRDCQICRVTNFRLHRDREGFIFILHHWLSRNLSKFNHMPREPVEDPGRDQGQGPRQRPDQDIGGLCM